MIPNNLQDSKPLPRHLEEALMDCYDREQHNIEPFVICTSHTTFELIKRGMLSAKTFMKYKRVFFGFYVTQMGIDYLSQL
jgi:hypothetical protein